MGKKKVSSIKKSKAKTKPKKSGPKGPMKRPKTEQDFEDFESLAAMQCTLTEICGFFKISMETLIQRIRDQYAADDFSAKYHEFRAQGKASLRRVMWDKAMNGDGQTQRWLSRQYLGMSDKVEFDDKRQTTEDDKGKVLEPAERLKLIHGDSRKA